MPMFESLRKPSFRSAYSQFYYLMMLLLFISFFTISLSGRIIFKLRNDIDRLLLSRYSCDSITLIPGLEVTRPGSSPKSYYACERNSLSLSDKHIVELAKNDPRFLKVFIDGQNQISPSLLFNDPEYKQQTFFFGQQEDKSGETVYYHNFPLLWDQNINGKGISIIVVDDGLDTTHSELKDSYDPNLSHNYVEDNTNPHTVTDDHGTQCTGLIASKPNNGKCGVGAAFGARIGAVRIFGGNTSSLFGTTIAQAVTYKYERTHIYSLSWVPRDDGKTVERRLPIAAENLKHAARYGRDGKGSIHVWATGNGGSYSDHCGYNWYLQLPGSFAVSATTWTGKIQSYGEKCTATLVSCISGSVDDEERTLFTTLPNDECRKTFSGTSACPPIVSSAIAGLLQVKGDLTVRDVRDIIIRSSLQIDEDAIINTAGLSFSLYFGFGLVQPDKMVELATSPSYKRLSPPRICMTPTFSPNIGCDGRCAIHSSIFTSGCVGGASTLDTVEMVIVTLSIQSTIRGSLYVVLTSPTGTNVRLLEPRPRDTSSEALTDWDIKLLTTYDERSYGHWKIKINVPTGVTTTLVSWRMALHGRLQSTDPSNQHNFIKRVVCKEDYDKKNLEILNLCTGSSSDADTETEDVDPFASERTDVEIIKKRPKTFCERYGLTLLPVTSWLPWLLHRLSIC
ncbi:Neuroendocrine convertase 1 [Thelohanellus kitauei]|uniref:Neuroendocrine convertase 1 n=1 Tax=Thelohanellus kitauei TaxID=669202 RepID=A0A0C2JP54_THEKT|nr:Neuroendocrine convertase 1 [Thelohanellus kitauei]